MLNAADIDKLVFAYFNLKRLKLAGYGDTRVTGLTTVNGLVTDIQTFRDSAGAKDADRPLFDAAIDSVRWLASVDLLDDTIVSNLTTVATDSVTATTDLSYNAYGATGFPSSAVPRAAKDLTVFMPANADA